MYIRVWLGIGMIIQQRLWLNDVPMDHTHHLKMTKNYEWAKLYSR